MEFWGLGGKGRVWITSIGVAFLVMSGDRMRLVVEVLIINWMNIGLLVFRLVWIMGLGSFVGSKGSYWFERRRDFDSSMRA